ncbi:MAG: DNA polymerase III subunit delta' [Hyphomicrobiales bacterium]|nr:DNA polymerase III subunit delta' [Hyphomicrobiales bacterium]
MARKPEPTDYQRLMCDRLENIAYPGEHSNLLGHDDALVEISHAYKKQRMHHAWLVTGPKGTGKATLALAVAAYLLRYPDISSTPDQIAIPGPSDDTFRLISRGGHPNVLHITRPLNEKTGKFRREITVDEVRKLRTFFTRTRVQDSWRICIIDSADELNISATNALLKILEEPPERTLFFVLANYPGRLLPTIRSRCRQLHLRPLTDENLYLALEHLGVKLSHLDDSELDTLYTLSQGSVRRAINLFQLDGIVLHHKFGEILAANSQGEPDWLKIHKLADELSRVNKDEQFRLLLDITQIHISNCLRNNNTLNDMNSFNDKPESQSAMTSQSPVPAHLKQTMLSRLAQLCEVWENTAASVSLADSYNLDRKQIILNLFGSLARVH